MKIHIVPSISEEASGPSYSVVRLCESLIEQGNRVALAALDWSSIAVPPVFLKTFPLGVGPRRLGRSPKMKKWLDVEVSSGRVSILHNHGMWQMNAIYPSWSKRKGNVDLIVSPRGAFSEWAMNHGSHAKKIFWPMLQKPALSMVTCFHATAESEYEDIRRMGFRQPVAIIPNGIDVPPPHQNTISDIRTLLFLGRIHPIKGLDMLLRAWGGVQARFTDWKLRIVGSDTGYYGSSGYLMTLRSMVNSLRLQRVEFCDALYGAEKLQAYREAELFVLPTYSENFGMTVAESLAAGTPVIVTRGAPWSGVVNNQAGWWVDTDVNAMVHTLQIALEKKSRELAEMGAAGRLWMETDFSWGSIGKRMQATYEWLRLGGDSPAWVKTN
jgi:glycosyltransferase involved in cell wall biosynthesis